LSFLRSLGLTERKILLSINDWKIFKTLKNDEKDALKKFELYGSQTIQQVSSLLGAILMIQEPDIMRLLKIKFINNCLKSFSKIFFDL
jgi:hypothetical protein